MVGEDEQRLREVFGANTVPRVSRKALTEYQVYLVKHLSPGCLVTGREDFPWEEFYVDGPGDPEEYEELKKEKPSYSDRYRLMKILSQPSASNDLITLVERLSDGKQFELELSWLEAVDNPSCDFTLLEELRHMASQPVIAGPNNSLERDASLRRRPSA